MLQSRSSDLNYNIKCKQELSNSFKENLVLECDEIIDVTMIILEFCENALSDLAESMTSLMTLDSTVSLRDLKSELRKCKQDTTQLHKFGELVNVFCPIKDNVQNNTIRQLKNASYMLCFEELFDFMTVK